VGSTTASAVVEVTMGITTRASVETAVGKATIEIDSVGLTAAAVAKTVVGSISATAIEIAMEITLWPTATLVDLASPSKTNIASEACHNTATLAAALLKLMELVALETAVSTLGFLTIGSLAASLALKVGSVAASLARIKQTAVA